MMWNADGIKINGTKKIVEQKIVEQKIQKITGWKYPGRFHISEWFG